MIKWIVFAAASVPLVVISWKPLHDPKSHGFHRFFAWECILGLFLINVRYWFRDPLAWNQIIAWSLLMVSLIPLAFGVHSLCTRGKPVEQREGDPTLLAFEKTTTLVTSGIYRYIRHPLYCSLLMLAWGILFKLPSWIGTVLAATSSGFLFATARADEKECIRFFGDAYREYMKRTKMFIPFLV